MKSSDATQSLNTSVNLISIYTNYKCYKQWSIIQLNGPSYYMKQINNN